MERNAINITVVQKLMIIAAVKTNNIITLIAAQNSTLRTIDALQKHDVIKITPMETETT